jgi:hypothetical protein
MFPTTQRPTNALPHLGHEALRDDLEALWKKEKACNLDEAFTEFGLNSDQRNRILDLFRDHSGPQG